MHKNCSSYLTVLRYAVERTFSNCHVTSKKITLQQFNDFTVFYDLYACIKNGFQMKFSKYFVIFTDFTL